MIKVQGKLDLLTIEEPKTQSLEFPYDVFEFMQAEAKIDRECTWILHLNNRNQVVCKELISMGTYDASLSHPREVFRRAIIQAAFSIIIVHNHPGGNPAISHEDVETYRDLVKASEIIGIPIHDFMIITPGGYSSFIEEKIDKEK